MSENAGQSPGSLPDRLVLERGPHKIEKQDEAAECKKCFENAADRRRKLQKAPQGPPCGPGRANHFRTDENPDRDEGR